MLVPMSIGSSTRRVRLAASPLLVAVALGLLGPAVLEDEDSTPSSIERTPSDGELSTMLEAMTRDMKHEAGRR